MQISENFHSQMKFEASLSVSEVCYVGIMVLMGFGGVLTSSVEK